jgi:flavin-binding protein dodecin
LDLEVSNVAKVVELVASSPNSFDEAVRNAADEAQRTIRGIHGLEVVGWNVKMNNGKIREYRVNVKVAFGVEPERK